MQPTPDTQRIREVVEAIEELDSGQAALRGRFTFSKEMETALRDFQNHATIFRTIATSDALPTAIEMNLLRYSVAAIQQALALMATKSPDEGIRILRASSDRLRNLAAEAPIRSIVPRMRRTRISGPAEARTTAECPGCGKVVAAHIESGRIVIEFEEQDETGA